MRTPTLLWLSVGQPAPMRIDGQLVQTAILKHPARGAVHLDEHGLAGDKQADVRAHGGPDKAVCVYASEHYAFWENHLGTALEPAAFGENFTTAGLVETEMCIGDIYAVGGARVQVSQPRSPCFRLAAIHNRPELINEVAETGFTGFYLRCLSPGLVAAGDSLTLVERRSPGVTVDMANQSAYLRDADPELIRSVADAEGLAPGWRRGLRSRLEAHEAHAGRETPGRRKGA